MQNSTSGAEFLSLGLGLQSFPGRLQAALSGHAFFGADGVRGHTACPVLSGAGINGPKVQVCKSDGSVALFGQGDPSGLVDYTFA